MLKSPCCSTVNWVPNILCKQTAYPVSIILIPNLDQVCNQ